MVSNLIAYIPFFNNRYMQWFEKHHHSNLYLISQKLAEELVPRLSRNVVALPTHVMMQMLLGSNLFLGLRRVDIFSPDGLPISNAVLPDEDVSHALAEKYFEPFGISHTFEDIRARWDMTAVKKKLPVMVGIESTSDLSHRLRMDMALDAAPRSPDWWRQIGAALFVGDDCVATACNNHYPTEYETDGMGDPRMNVDAGQIGKYISFHSEKTVITMCAEKGISTKGTSLYTTVFPCEDCARAIVLSGISNLFFEEGYSALDALEVLRGAGIKIVRVEKTP